VKSYHLIIVAVVFYIIGAMFPVAFNKVRSIAGV
jgi:hypothetical protein